MYFAVLNASISSNWLLRDYGRLYAGLNLLDLKTMAIYGTEQVVAVEYKTSANHIQYIIHFPKEESKILQYANCKYLHIDGPVLGFLSSTDLHLWTFDEAWTIECPGKPLAVLLNGLSCSLFYASDAGLFLKGATSHQHVLPALSTGLPYFGIPLFKNSFENIPIEFCIQRTVSEICLFRQGHEVWALTTASCIQIIYHLQFQDTIVVKLAGNVWVQIVNGVIVAEWSDYVAGYVDISQNVLHLFNCNGGDIFVPLFESPPAMSGHANQQLALDLLHTQISALNSQLLLLDTKRRESAEKMYNSENPLQIISDSLTEKALAIPKSFQVKWIAAEFIAPFLLSIHCSIRNTSRCAFTSFTIIPLIESHESCTSKSFPGKIDPASTAKLECIIECNEMLGLVEVLCTWQTESGCFTRIVVCDTLIIANNSALARSCFFFSKRIMFPATGIIWEEIVKQMGFNHASKFHCTRNNTNSSIQLIHFNDHIVVLVSDSSRKMLLWNCEILRKLIAQEAGTTTSDAKIYPEIVDGTPAPSGLYLCVVALNKSKLDILNGLSRLFNRY